MKRSEYPSQKKYRENNPSVSFRLTKQDKTKLDEIIKATGKPLSKYMVDIIHDKIFPYMEISDLETSVILYDELVIKLENEERFTVPCSVCGKPMKFSSKKSNWTTKVHPTLKQVFGKWMHSTCTPK